jgi:hypothetical protein
VSCAVDVSEVVIGIVVDVSEIAIVIVVTDSVVVGAVVVGSALLDKITAAAIMTASKTRMETTIEIIHAIFFLPVAAHL